jgi:D-cysteine desulfhydrase
MTIPEITTPLYFHETLAGNNQVFLKREDLLPYSFGGNKARIGLCYVEDMEKAGCNHMLAYGNARSNLCRVLSNLCAAKGYRLTILSPADDDGQQRPSMNGMLCRQLGARVIPCLKTGVAESVDAAMETIRAEGDTPYYIYGDRTGQGNKATPVAAYASQYAPLMEQCKAQLGFLPDVICLALGTGMTQAGLLCGQSVYDHGDGAVPQIVGLSTAREEAAATAHLSAYIQAFAQAHPAQADPDTAASRIRVYDRCRGSYGAPEEAISALVRQQFCQHGLPLDMTYTGKAYHAMQQLAQEEGWQDKRIVFIHTGGTPLFFDGVAGQK